MPSRSALAIDHLELDARFVYDRGMRNFRRLDVWQRSHRLAIGVNQTADGFRGRHRFGLGDQITRAAMSIPANIAEGAGRESVKEFRRFLTIALGSTAELESHVLLARDLGVVTDSIANDHLEEIGVIRRMLLKLRANVRS
ncbi:MAG: four helix bundle protein [Actinomycetota bacterium]|nr:four helix bundle protein [Actinomycetota bacterium]